MINLARWSTPSPTIMTVLSDLFIIGTEGLAKEAALLARSIDTNASIWPTIHYVTHDTSLLRQPRPFGVIDTLDEMLCNCQVRIDVVIGVGHPKLRQRITSFLRTNPNLRFPNLIHPQVQFDFEFSSLGIGNMITQGVVISCDTELGDFNLLNWNATVGHDCQIGSNNVINPGSSVSGNVKLGDACLIGTGARILEGRQVASDTTLGAGAVLTQSIMIPGGTYIGVPARIKIP